VEFITHFSTDGTKFLHLCHVEVTYFPHIYHKLSQKYLHLSTEKHRVFHTFPKKSTEFSTHFHRKIQNFSQKYTGFSQKCTGFSQNIHKIYHRISTRFITDYPQDLSQEMHRVFHIYILIHLSFNSCLIYSFKFGWYL
jgi:hypothetical protein